MALMTWGANYSVGIAAMDEQHQALMQALNDLHTAMTKGEAREVAGQLLTKLARYTKDHFRAEEAMLARNGYPSLAEHRAKHVDLNRQVEEYIHRFESGERALTVHLLHFLRDWLTVHIQKEDRAYGGWLNARGTH
jgi:hemerythrin-like metal-binding protein